MKSVLFFVIVSVFCLKSFAQSTADKQRYDQAIEFYEKGEYDSAKVLLLALNEKIESGQSNFKLRILNNLGNIQADLGKNTSALKYYQQALTISKNSNSKLEKAEILKNIGALYVSWKNFGKAKWYYEQSLIQAKMLNAPKVIADCYNNLGTVDEQIGDFSSAKNNYFKALSFYKKVKEKPSVGMSYSNLAIVYKLEGSRDSSLFYNLEALKIAQETNDQWMEAAIMNNIGNFYGEVGNFQEAEKYLNKSLQLSRKIDAIEIEIMSLESLSDAAKNSGNYHLAYQFLKEMKSKEIDFNSLEQKRNLDELEVKYQTKEKEFENRELQRENEQKSRNTKIYSFIFLIILCIVILIGFILFKQKKNRLEEQRRIDVSNALISSDSEARLSIARDLHDSVGQQLAILKMHTSQFNSEQSDLMIDQLTNDVRMISHKLVPEAFSFGLANALKELREQITSSNKLKVDLKLPEKGIENFNPTQQLALYRIIQELISNVIRHAHATTISIELTTTQHELILKLKDDGRGFDVEKVKRSNGLGWKNIEARVILLKGKDTLESSKENGSTYHLIVPYA